MAEIFRPNSDKNEHAAEFIGPKVSTAMGWNTCSIIIFITLTTIITSAVCMSVCVSVCRYIIQKLINRFWWVFLEGWDGRRNNRLDFGGDRDYATDPWFLDSDLGTFKGFAKNNATVGFCVLRLALNRKCSMWWIGRPMTTVNLLKTVEIAFPRPSISHAYTVYWITRCQKRVSSAKLLGVFSSSVRT